MMHSKVRFIKYNCLATKRGFSLGWNPRSSGMEGTRQAVLGPSDHQKVPASLSLFLKSEKIPALLFLRKGPECRPFPGPASLRHRSQITEGPVLRPFSYTFDPITSLALFTYQSIVPHYNQIMNAMVCSWIRDLTWQCKIPVKFYGT
jgi:hypothetical protein